jgi:multidrug efflux pump subunit AcrA (membrane-fusion protein)
MTDSDEWMRADEAAKVLGLSERSALRYASGSSARIRTSKRTGSKRLWLYRPDVEALAAELQPARRAPDLPPLPKPELVPAGELLGYLRQRDEELKEAQRALQAAAMEIGQARAELQRRQLVDEQLQVVQQERDEVRRQIARLRLQRLALAILVIVLAVAFIGFIVFVLNT